MAGDLRGGAAVGAKRSAQPYKLFVFDTETTGTSKKAQIVELAVLEASVTKDHDRPPARFESLVRPTTSTVGAYRIHGISAEMVKGADGFSEVWRRAVDFVCAHTPEHQVPVLLAHNAAFDTRMLRQELAAWLHLMDFNSRHSNAKPAPPEVVDGWRFGCTLKLFRVVWPGLRAYRLGALAEEFGIEHIAAHHAMGDVLVTDQLLTLASKDMVLDTLMEAIVDRIEPLGPIVSVPAAALSEPEDEGIALVDEHEGTGESLVPHSSAAKPSLTEGGSCAERQVEGRTPAPRSNGTSVAAPAHSGMGLGGTRAHPRPAVPLSGAASSSPSGVGGGYFYVRGSKSYHTSRQCPSLSRSTAILAGQGSPPDNTSPCSRCPGVGAAAAARRRSSDSGQIGAVGDGAVPSFLPHTQPADARPSAQALPYDEGVAGVVSPAPVSAIPQQPTPPAQQQQSPTRYFGTKYGECYHTVQDCYGLRSARAVEEWAAVPAKKRGCTICVK